MLYSPIGFMRPRIEHVFVVAVATSVSIAGCSSETIGADEAEANAAKITARVASKPADVPSGPPAAGHFRVHTIDVGSGLAILVQGHDFNLLFDGGSGD